MKKTTAFLFVLLMSALASAQTFEVGSAVLLNEENAIDVSDFRAFVSVAGLEIPVPGDTYTGVTVEAGYYSGTFVEQIDNVSTGLDVRSGLVWAIWSMNRTETKLFDMLPVIAGADIRIARGGPAFGSDFDVAFRLVGGYRLTDNLGVYAYFLEDQTPFSFAVGWKF